MCGFCFESKQPSKTYALVHYGYQANGANRSTPGPTRVEVARFVAWQWREWVRDRIAATLLNLKVRKYAKRSNQHRSSASIQDHRKQALRRTT